MRLKNRENFYGFFAAVLREKSWGIRRCDLTFNSLQLPTMKTDFSFKLVAAAVLTGVFLAIFNPLNGAKTVAPATSAVVTATAAANP